MIVWKLLQGNLPYKLTYGQLCKCRILPTIILFEHGPGEGYCLSSTQMPQGILAGFRELCIHVNVCVVGKTAIEYTKALTV